MSRGIGAFEAENRLDMLFDRVEQGEEVLIARRRKAAADVRVRGVGVNVGGVRIKKLVDEGRP